MKGEAVKGGSVEAGGGEGEIKRLKFFSFHKNLRSCLR